MSSGSVAYSVPRVEDANSLSRAHTDEDVTPNEIAVGVIIGRSSEYFDFFVFGIACVLVFPFTLFPFMSRLDGTLMAFAIFALAMFGVFELKLPQAISNRLDRVANRTQGGSLWGAAVLGVVSSLLVSPCVSAPLAGALLYISASGDAVGGGLKLFALGLGTAHIGVVQLTRQPARRRKQMVCRNRRCGDAKH